MVPKKRGVPPREIPVRELFKLTKISVAPMRPPPPPTPQYVAGQIIVRFEEKLIAGKALAQLKAPGFALSHHAFASEYLHVVRATLKDGTPLTVGQTHELATVLAKTHGVRFTEVDQWQQAFAVPNDKLYSAQWHFPALNLRRRGTSPRAPRRW